MKIISKKSEDDEVSEFNSEVEDDDKDADVDDDDDADVESAHSPMLTNVSAFSSEVDGDENKNDLDGSARSPKLSLEEENDMLKADLSSLKKEVTRLRQRESLSKVQARKQLPTTLRQIAASNSRRRQRPGQRPQRKFSGTALNDRVIDDIGTEQPDLEMHESGRGLFHRKQHYSPLTQQTQKQQNFFPDDESGQETEDEKSSVFLLAGGTNSEREEDDVVLPGSFWAMVQDRAGWLVGLLILQSMSSFILARNERLLQEHVIIVRFLTMLVGAGGNAGNQASVRVIRGLAIGSVNHDNLREFLTVELKMCLALSVILGLAGCLRAAIFMTPVTETIAITTSLFFIVFISIILGAVLPLMMNYIHIDPAHSSTTIQVIMDILGVTITVYVCSAILNSTFHSWILGD